MDTCFRDCGGEARGMPAGLWGSRRAITVSDGTRIVTARRMRRRYTQQKAISKLLQYSHTQTCIHIDIHIHTHTYTRMHTHAYISIYTICVYMYVHACRRNAMYAFMHAFTSACMHDCGVYVYIYIYVLTHIHRVCLPICISMRMKVHFPNPPLVGYLF